MEIERMNIAGANHSIAIGERNTVLGDHSILIGKDLKTQESYKLIVKYNPLHLGLISQAAPEIDINETISEREHNLISSALNATLYLEEEKRINGTKYLRLTTNQSNIKDPITPDRFLDSKGLSGNALNADRVKIFLEEYANLKCARMLEDARHQVDEEKLCDAIFEGDFDKDNKLQVHFNHSKAAKKVLEYISPIIAGKDVTIQCANATFKDLVVKIQSKDKEIAELTNLGLEGVKRVSELKEDSKRHEACLSIMATAQKAFVELGATDMAKVIADAIKIMQPKHK